MVPGRGLLSMPHIEAKMEPVLERRPISEASPSHISHPSIPSAISQSPNTSHVPFEQTTPPKSFKEKEIAQVEAELKKELLHL